MNDERFKELLDLDSEGFPSLAGVTREIMRGPDCHLQVSEPSSFEAALRNTNDIGLTTGALADAMEASMRDEDAQHAVLYSSIQCTDLSTAVTNFEEACQSGPGDYMERRERDRSGTAPKKRKWKDRAKTKAARKARKANR